VKKMMMLLALLLLSVSCVDLNGTLQVNEAFNVKKKSGFLNLQRKVVTVLPGQYTAKLVSKSSKKLNLVLKGGALGEINIPIKSHDNLNIPRNGQLYIEGKNVGQPFNVSGTINTTFNHYGYTNEIVKCQIDLKEKRCEKVCNKMADTCEIVCNDVTITIEGLQEVSYHFLSTERHADLEFSPENSTAIAAILPVSGIETNRIIDSESACR